jgi:hypothetical protein
MLRALFSISGFEEDESTGLERSSDMGFIRVVEESTNRKLLGRPLRTRGMRGRESLGNGLLTIDISIFHHEHIYHWRRETGRDKAEFATDESNSSVD